MNRDGGLIKAVLDYLVSLKATTISGFASLDRDFTAAQDIAGGPRLIVKTGTNTKIVTTDRTDIRAVSVTIEIWGKSEDVVDTQSTKVDAVLDALAENPHPISTEMDEGSSVNEMSIIDNQSSQVQTGVWKSVLMTEWEIGITRS